MLNGWKTYVVMILGVIVNGAASMGYITPETVDMINKILIFLGLGILRHAVKTSSE